MAISDDELQDQINALYAMSRSAYGKNATSDDLHYAFNSMLGKQSAKDIASNFRNLYGAKPEDLDTFDQPFKTFHDEAEEARNLYKDQFKSQGFKDEDFNTGKPLMLMDLESSATDYSNKASDRYKRGAVSQESFNSSKAYDEAMDSHEYIDEKNPHWNEIKAAAAAHPLDVQLHNALAYTSPGSRTDEGRQVFYKLPNGDIKQQPEKPSGFAGFALGIANFLSNNIGQVKDQYDPEVFEKTMLNQGGVKLNLDPDTDEGLANIKDIERWKFTQLPDKDKDFYRLPDGTIELNKQYYEEEEIPQSGTDSYGASVKIPSYKTEDIKGAEKIDVSNPDEIDAILNQGNRFDSKGALLGIGKSLPDMLIGAPAGVASHTTNFFTQSNNRLKGIDELGNPTDIGNNGQLFHEGSEALIDLINTGSAASAIAAAILSGGAVVAPELAAATELLAAEEVTEATFAAAAEASGGSPELIEETYNAMKAAKDTGKEADKIAKTGEKTVAQARLPKGLKAVNKLIGNKITEVSAFGALPTIDAILESADNGSMGVSTEYRELLDNPDASIQLLESNMSSSGADKLLGNLALSGAFSKGVDALMAKYNIDSKNPDALNEAIKNDPETDSRLRKMISENPKDPIIVNTAIAQDPDASAAFKTELKQSKLLGKLNQGDMTKIVMDASEAQGAEIPGWVKAMQTPWSQAFMNFALIHPVKFAKTIASPRATVNKIKLAPSKAWDYTQRVTNQWSSGLRK